MVSAFGSSSEQAGPAEASNQPWTGAVVSAASCSVHFWRASCLRQPSVPLLPPRLRASAADG